MSKMVDKNGGQKYERYFDYISNHINQFCMYRKISNISQHQYQNINDSPHVLQLSLPNPLKPGVKSRMKM